MDIQSFIPPSAVVEASLDGPLEHLPPFPLVAGKLLAPGLSADRIARIVGTDPVIAAKVLQIFSSNEFGATKRIGSIQEAIKGFGPDKIRSVALGITLFDNLIGRKPAAFDHTFFWRHSLCLAGICRSLADQCGYPDPEEAYQAGLIHDIGKILFDVAGRIRYGEFVANLKNYDGPVDEKERDIIGLGHDEIGAFYCHRWHLPDRLVLAVRFHHQPFAHHHLPEDVGLLIAIVSFADFVAWSQGFGSFDTLRHPMLNPDVAERIPTETIRLDQLTRAMDGEVRSASAFYGFSFPTSEEFREVLLRANIELGQLNTRYFFLHDSLRQEFESLSQLKESITRPHRSLDPEEIIAETLDAIHQDFGFDRIFALEIDAQQRFLRAFASKDETAIGVDVNRLEIRPVSATGGFIECLRTHVPVLITGRNREEVEALDFLKTREFGIVPFSCNNKIIGLLGMDNAVSRKPIRLTDLSAVAIVANELGLALENGRTFEEIKQRADYDGLTRVYNRTTIDMQLARAFERAERSGTPFSVAMVDVDHFKRFNDRYGHLSGDSILKLIAGTLTKFSRPTEVVGRYGGEEFMCILQDTDLAGAVRYGERIRAKVEDLGRLLVNRFPDHDLTISAGVVEYHPVCTAKEEMIGWADKALYAAKETGRNQLRQARVGAGGEIRIEAADAGTVDGHRKEG